MKLTRFVVDESPRKVLRLAAVRRRRGRFPHAGNRRRCLSWASFPMHHPTHLHLKISAITIQRPTGRGLGRRCSALRNRALDQPGFTQRS